MRIFAASDLHGKLNFSVPPCDLLLLAGDLCPDFAPGTEWGADMQLQWLKSQFANWLICQPAKHIGFTLGNHDFINPQYHDIGDLAPLCHVDEHVDYEGVTVWFSPWCNPIGSWAWMSFPDHLGKIYSRIAEYCDIIVSHQPPFGYGDKVPDYLIRHNEDPEGHVGSQELLNTIYRTQAKAVVCGHIHNGHGEFKVEHEQDPSPFVDYTKVYNVSVVNEQYQRVYEPTEIIL